MSKRYLLGVCLAICLLLSAVVLRMVGPGQVSIDQSSVATQESHIQSIPDKTDPKTPSATNSAQSPTEDDQSVEANKPAEDEHLSQLTPEMRQAIKDKLLLHGSMETQKNPDGSIGLPTNGRYTQMPVAVQMPDGSIQIKEYSYIPKAK